MSDVTLYAWARPTGAFQQADHTWVTSYPAPYDVTPLREDYWYCWGAAHPAGDGHPARLLGSGPADADAARCICTPNVRHARDFSSYGGIELYGVEGVCHQVSNRILYACGGSGAPLFVTHAKLYWLSHHYYGPYGTDEADWERRRERCPVSTPPGGAPGAFRPRLQPFLERLATGPGEASFLAPRMRDAHALLLEEKRALDREVLTGRMGGRHFAELSNELLADFVEESAGPLGTYRTKEFLGVEPGEPFVLVDPDIAELCDYGPRR